MENIIGDRLRWSFSKHYRGGWLKRGAEGIMINKMREGFWIENSMTCLHPYWIDKGIYQQGKRIGMWTSYARDRSGNLSRVEESRYESGQLHGQRIRFLMNGASYVLGFYKNGEMIS